MAQNDAAAIGDYGLIGDCRAAALISREGSLDWLCLPRFDKPSIFATLVDPQRGGRFQIRPAGEFRTQRRYIPDTNVLETTFHTSDGSVALRDLMPVASEADKRRHLQPDHLVLREIEGLQGDVNVDILYAPQPDYARARPFLQQRGALGLYCEAHGGVFVLRSEVELKQSGDHQSARGSIRLHAGERKYLSLTYADDGPQVLPTLGASAQEKVQQSVRWWQAWARRCQYQGRYRDMVVRSALVLKLMTYAPSGAVIAAPTTSLPEVPGGVRNWDYRFCWLRDASLTFRALHGLGYHLEAEAFVQWLLTATRLTWPELQVVYDVFGESHLPESTLDHFSGHANSRPVRIGNDAYTQLQLDIYGDVLDAVASFARPCGRLDRETARMLEGLGRTVCSRWREPDEGIWEQRGGRFQHTHSKVMCWVALDRLIQMHDRGDLRVNADALRAERESIRAAIEQHGYNATLGSYTRTFDGDDLDASLLELPMHGYIDARHPRMRSTCDRIRNVLGHGSLIDRYHADDGLPSREGAFGICGFWAVECLARRGDVEAARRAFEELLGYANDLGLLAEEIDPTSGAALGNFPQAFTHIGLINAALVLQQSAADDVRESGRTLEAHV